MINVTASTVDSAALIPKIYVSCPSVGPHVRNNVEAFYNAGMLSRFATTFVNHPNSRLACLMAKMGPKTRRLAQRRVCPEVPWRAIITNPGGELIRSFCSVVLKSPRLTHQAWAVMQPRFDAWSASQISAEDDVVYVYEQAGLQTARRARALGKCVILEQISQHHSYLRKMLIEQTRDVSSNASVEQAIEWCSESQPWNKSRNLELAAADVIFCNSEFTKRTLQASGLKLNRIVVTPLGCPPVTARPPLKDKIVFLHAGTESIRKGTHLLYSAWEALANDAAQPELWFAGGRSFVGNEGLKLSGAVTRFGPLSQTELFQKMSEASVLVLPTLADGFGMVITEALARGLPVITTDSAGAADLIESRVAGGVVIPTGDRESLIEAMRWCIEHPSALYDLGLAGQQIAARWQWSDYQRALVDRVKHVVVGSARGKDN